MVSNLILTMCLVWDKGLYIWQSKAGPAQSKWHAAKGIRIGLRDARVWFAGQWSSDDDRPCQDLMCNGVRFDSRCQIVARTSGSRQCVSGSGPSLGVLLRGIYMLLTWRVLFFKTIMILESCTTSLPLITSICVAWKSHPCWIPKEQSCHHSLSSVSKAPSRRYKAVVGWSQRDVCQGTESLTIYLELPESNYNLDSSGCRGWSLELVQMLLCCLSVSSHLAILLGLNCVAVPVCACVATHWMQFPPNTAQNVHGSEVLLQPSPPHNPRHRLSWRGDSEVQVAKCIVHAAVFDRVSVSNVEFRSKVVKLQLSVGHHACKVKGRVSQCWGVWNSITASLITKLDLGTGHAVTGGSRNICFGPEEHSSKDLPKWKVARGQKSCCAAMDV
jgi:hypothetical protein